MLRHCKKWSVACKARVKQVKRWTYPNMVFVPLCTKLEMLDIIATLYHPPGERGAKALIPAGSLYCERRKEVEGPT